MSACVQVSLRVTATPRRAFEVFTRDIALWWRPNMLFQVGPGRPGVLSFEPGEGGRLVETCRDGSVFAIGTVTAWEPGVRLAFGWRQANFGPDQATQVEVSFTAVGDQTRVTVEHRGWDSVPQGHVARHGFPEGVFLQRNGEWWQALLAAYRGQAASADASPMP